MSEDASHQDWEMTQLTDDQRVELDRRLADYEADPEGGEEWKVVRARIESKIEFRW